MAMSNKNHNKYQWRFLNWGRYLEMPGYSRSVFLTSETQITCSPLCHNNELDKTRILILCVAFTFVHVHVFHWQVSVTLLVRGFLFSYISFKPVRQKEWRSWILPWHSPLTQMYIFTRKQMLLLPVSSLMWCNNCIWLIWITINVMQKKGGSVTLSTT